MKRALTFIIISLLLFSLVSAKVGITSRATEDLEDTEDDSNSNDVEEGSNSNDGDQEQNQEDNSKDENETEIEDEEENECEEWKCTHWSNCTNNQKTRICTKMNDSCVEDLEKPKTSKSCEEKEKIQFHNRTTECPEECECSGSVVKCWFENGTREMTITAGKSGNIIVQIKGVEMKTNVTLYKSDDKIYGVFKNNETKVVRMLPDQVKEKIRERLQRQLENEEIKLEDDGSYQYEGKEKAKLFAFIPVKLRVNAEIDPETGEVIKLNKAWWAVFTSGDTEGMIVGAGCGTVSPDSRNECCKNKNYDFYNEATAECEFNQ